MMKPCRHCGRPTPFRMLDVVTTFEEGRGAMSVYRGIISSPVPFCRECLEALEGVIREFFATKDSE